MRLRRILYISGAFFLALVKFTGDIIEKNVELEIGGLSIVRHIVGIGVFVLLFLFLEAIFRRRDQNPVRALGALLIITGAVSVLTFVLTEIPVAGFDAKNLSLLPLDYPTIFIASLITLAYGLFALLLLRALRDLVLFQRRKGTLRNFTILLGLILATSLSTIALKPMDSSFLTGGLTAVTVLVGGVNSFRLPWIVYLRKREKILNLIFSLVLFVGFTILNVIVLRSPSINRSLLYYSYPVKVFIEQVMIFGNIFFGMTFISTLFHLPTAEAFDRKRSEVASLHNLGRLITQVFDFDELADTVTTMTLEVCEASSAWLEVIHLGDEVLDDFPKRQTSALSAYETDGERYVIQLAGMKNITQSEIEQLISTDTGNLRESVMVDLKPVLVDDMANDDRFHHLKKSSVRHASLVVVPLVAHGTLTGILYATKEGRYGFVKDDVDLISAFADQATVAIENSRLIKKSIERERLLREMLVAQEMQKKLLPQILPQHLSLELGAISTPAFEVGGDYYDFAELGSGRLGIIVGDVSGKGVPAAFYMSVMKGIFQALGKTCTSPREFMIKANEALAGSIDKHSFVSLIYAIVDTRTGSLTLARAGHCPLLHIGTHGAEYLRPGGMGVGLSSGGTFDGAIEESTITLKDEDLCVFYTDGITEARRNDEEFGYDRLRDVALRERANSAPAICTGILNEVKTFSENKASHDDLTLVVLKWKGKAGRMA